MKIKSLLSCHPISRPRRCVILFLCISFIVCFGCMRYNSDSARKTEQARFDTLSAEYIRDLFLANTLSLHFTLSDPAPYGLSDTDTARASIGDYSYEAKQDNLARDTRYLNDLDTFSSSDLTEEQQRTLSIFHASLEHAAASKDYLLYPSYLGTDGLASQVPISLTEYSFDNEADIKTYLALVCQIPDLFDQIISYEKERMSNNIINPDFVIKDTITQIDDFLALSEDENMLVESFDAKIKSMDCLSNDQKNTYITNNRALIRQMILPAYEALKDELTDLLSVSAKNSIDSAKSSMDSAKNSPNNTGRICTLKDGKKYYALLLKARTGTDKTPEKCISCLEDFLAETRQNILKLSKENPKLLEAYNTATPVLSDSKEILEELESDTLIDFPEISPISYSLKDLPAALSGTSATAFYMVPPVDQPDENIIYLNNMRLMERDLFSTLAHEGYPGHMYQTNYFLETKPSALRYLLSSDGYVEGWGVYAQLYSYSHMKFKNVDERTEKQLQKLYYYNDIFSLEISSLCDLYVNYNNMNEKQLTDFLGTYGITPDAASKTYQYVIENPMTYPVYGLGFYEIYTLKQDMEEAYAYKFDLKYFHKSLLETGPCDFTLLRKCMKDAMEIY